MEGGAHRKHTCTLGAGALGDLDRALDGSPVTGDYDLTRRIVVGRLADFTLRCLGGDCDGIAMIEAEKRCHGSSAYRCCVLHGAATDSQKSRGIGQREGARSSKCGVFTKRVAGHVFYLAGDRYPVIDFKHPNDSKT